MRLMIAKLKRFLKYSNGLFYSNTYIFRLITFYFFYASESVIICFVWPWWNFIAHGFTFLLKFLSVLFFNISSVYWLFRFSCKLIKCMKCLISSQKLKLIILNKFNLDHILRIRDYWEISCEKVLKPDNCKLHLRVINCVIPFPT